MNLAITKKQKEAKAQRLAEEQRRREIEAKINIKRTLSNMRKQSKKFDQFKADCIEKARKATLVGDKTNYALAKKGLKFAIEKQRAVDTMIQQFEITMQVNEMNNVISDFVGSINILSEDMKSTCSIMDLSKAQAAYDKAIAENAGQYEAMDAFLTTAVDSMDAISEISDEVDDKEIDSLIASQAVDSEAQSDDLIEDKISEIREKVTTTI